MLELQGRNDRMINHWVASLYEAVRNASATDHDIAQLYARLKQQRLTGAPTVWAALVTDRGWPALSLRKVAGPRRAIVAAPIDWQAPDSSARTGDQPFPLGWATAPRWQSKAAGTGRGPTIPVRYRYLASPMCV